MNIFPVKKLKIETSLTKDEIRERIARASKYKISIDGNNFEIIRITKQRHFPPLIKGCMFDLDNSSIVNIKLCSSVEQI